MTRPRLGSALALCLAVVSAGCGGGSAGGTPPTPPPTPQPEVQVPTGPYAIAAQATPGESWKPIVLGQGIDSLTDAARELCLRAPAVTRAWPEGYFSNGAMDSSRVATLLSTDGDFTTRLPFDEGGPLSRFARANAWGGLSVGGSFALGLYTLEVESVDPYFTAWDVVPDGPDFVARCGDGFVFSRRRGGQLFALLRFDFADAAAQADWYTKGAIGLTLGALEDPSRLVPFAGKVGVHVAALQRGGDPERLSRRLRPEGSTDVASLWSRDCSAADPRPCRDFLRAVAAYAFAAGADGFTDSLAANPADLRREFQNWQLAWRSSPPRWAPSGVLMARFSLDTLREGQEAVAERIRVLRAGILSASAALQARLLTAESTLAGNLAALRAAERACRDDFTDPADAAQVARCVDGALPEALAAAGYDAGLTVTSLSAP